MSMASYVSEEELERRIKAAREQGFEDGVEDMANRTDNDWHLDKKVPLGIIFAILIQTLGIIVVGTAWKTGVDARIERLEASDLDKKPQESRLVRLEEKLLSISSSLSRIELKLDQPAAVRRSP